MKHFHIKHFFFIDLFVNILLNMNVCLQIMQKLKFVGQVNNHTGGLIFRLFALFKIYHLRKN